VDPVEQLVQYSGAKDLRILAAEHGERDVDASLGEMLAHQAPAPGIDGPDLRGLHEQLLAAQMALQGPRRRVRHGPPQHVRDPHAQLRGGRPRERHDQQPVDVARPLRIGDQPHAALCQHLGLACAGGRGHQQIRSAMLDGPALAGREVHSSSSAVAGSAGNVGNAVSAARGVL